MEFKGFGRNSGPSAPPSSPILFGNAPQSSLNTSIPFTSPPVQPSQRNSDVPKHFPSQFSPIGHQSTNGHFGVLGATRPLPKAYTFQNLSMPMNIRSHEVQDMFGSATKSSGEDKTGKYFLFDALNAGTRSTSSAANLQNLKRARSPFRHSDEASTSSFNLLQYETEKSAAPLTRTTSKPPSKLPSLLEQHESNPGFNAWNGAATFPPKVVPRMTRSLPLAYSDEILEPNFRVKCTAERSAAPIPNSMQNSLNSARLQEEHISVSQIAELDQRTKSPPKLVPRKTRSSPMGYTDEILSPDWDVRDNKPEKSPPKATTFQVPKRTRSPSVAHSDKRLASDGADVQDQIERESQAKAKRLARFSAELKQSSADPFQAHSPHNRSDASAQDKRKFISNISVEDPTYSSRGSPLGDYDGMDGHGNSDTSQAIVGLCSDMCPETEREERERKGDLDRYERLDGDRNQTSKWLAVKKYNRTAEREAHLIRPLPVLQKTVNYLLNLINQPYDNNFLGIYNFLWDRMRAIRMDLRMQHIFNSDAIVMHEQMIRLHIIAMHEFCGYSKGEGFTEGFDAHLNIEQMNKTSVELFQMYDDHREKGIVFPTEKEFRGYYALLKLDKHPGYKVEPVELSLDLAKMTPELRKTPEVLFARDVARACRSGNFIAFFRHARNASYLQACLMHAHFGKMRSHGLASLHSGLQNNQGIPVIQIVKWIGMEEEDIENLLEYHGFSIKKYEDIYMVKDGAFLNSDKDSPTKCSCLVHLKKSATIFEDVFSNQRLSSPSKPIKGNLANKPDHKVGQQSDMLTWVNPVTDEMTQFEVRDDHRHNNEVLQAPSGGSLFTFPRHIGTPSISGRIRDNPLSTSPRSRDNPSSSPRSIDVPSLTSHKHKGMQQTFSPLEPLSTCPKSDYLSTGRSLSINLDGENVNYVTKLKMASDENIVNYESSMNVLRERSRESDMDRLLENRNIEDNSNINKHDANTSHQDSLEENMELQNEIFEQEELIKHRIEAARAKLRFFLRLWKRHSSKRRELRELQRLMSAAALSSLSLGPPILQNKLPENPSAHMELYNVVKARDDRWMKSWSKINVAELVLDILYEKNMHSKCFCWKLVLCIRSQDCEGNLPESGKQPNQSAGSWLATKLMGSEGEDGILFSSLGLSIWSNWAIADENSHHLCCLSILREVALDVNMPGNVTNALLGAGAVLFLVSENGQWDHDKARLHNLIMSLPPGSNLPLLILSVLGADDVEINLSSLIVNKLELLSLDKMKICSFSVVILSEANHLYSDERLRDGLRWLAEHSPVQPVLQRVKIRNLVLRYLSASMEKIEGMRFSEISPDHCISALNNALEKSTQDIILALKTNTNNWPSPEIELIDGYIEESMAARLELPMVGWNAPEVVEHALDSLRSCQLPEFSKDDWRNMGVHIQTQKLTLESNLNWYLTDACKMMLGDLAARESNLMVQRGATIEFDGVNHRIVPKWAMIFRRIFNWRLMNLDSNAYVLKHSQSCIPDDRIWTSHTLLADPSLDEMIEISCKVPRREFPPVEYTGEDGELNTKTQLPEKAVCINSEMDAYTEKSSEMQPIKELSRETKAGTLNSLLERCNMLQDMIDRKLYIYF